MKQKARIRAVTKAFTLIELLVVISIIAVLISLLLAGGSVRPQSYLARQCTNNLKQIGLGVHNYVSANDVFPWGCFRQHNLNDGFGRNRLSLYFGR